MHTDLEEALPGFARFVARNLGLHFPVERLSELAQKMTLLAKSQGHDDLQQYLLGIMSAPLSREQMKVLAGALTIGETYFLRDPKSYRAFEKELLPGLIAARRGTDKTLRIWSAGCSSGEEPYSIAILLSRALHDLPDWNVTLLATDINHQALERGRRGIYSKWSFRNAPAWLMEYFTRETDGYRIAPRIQKMVRFAHLNLADPDESAPSITRGMDFIFCRNVMLYFHAEQIQNTLARFHACLRDDGWLFIGPTEVDHHAVPGFACRHLDGALVLGKKDPGQTTRGTPDKGNIHPAPARAASVSEPVPPPKREAPPSAVAAAGVPEPVHPLEPVQTCSVPEEPDLLKKARAHYRAGRYEEAAALALKAQERGEAQASLALAANALANIGRFSEARDCCERAIALDRLRAETHYLLSIILEQLGDSEGAIASLRRALYIDQDYLLAYFALGNLCRRRGEMMEARQSFANALRLLKRRDPHEELPEADGMTAATLMRMIEDIAG